VIQPGTKIRLIHTDDPYTGLVPGNEGIVRRAWQSDPADGCDWVDVDWNDGSTLTLMQEVGDRWEVIT